MYRRRFAAPIALAGLTALTAWSAALAGTPMALIGSPNAGFQEKLATSEIQRYVYLRTGELLPTLQSERLPAQGDAIVVAQKGRPIVAGLAVEAHLQQAVAGLGPQQYALKTVSQGGRRVLLVVGGDDLGTLYGAYRFAEKLGVRFYMHGDVVPDRWLAAVPDVDEIGKPLFETRGVNPWGSHPFGFDLWNVDDYKQHVGQLAKMRMNFIGMHCYPEGHPYAEPTVWVGLTGDCDAVGRVTQSYPSVYYSAAFKPGWANIQPKRTGDYLFGGSLLFDRDDWGPDVLVGHTPRPSTPDGCNEVFNRTAAMFREAFGFARLVGVQTCIGTETPLVMPKAVRDRLVAQGKNPADPAVVGEVYEGIFRRIARAHPLDYYWLWTPEGWTWSGNSPEQLKATVDDIRIAHDALRRVGAPFQLATSGWVLGPQGDRAALDKHLPREIPISALSRRVGHEPVEPAFAEAPGRRRWAIPWMEDDMALANPQLWVGRTRTDAADALAYGCTGLLGLQWRTKILAPNLASLAQAGWDHGTDVRPANTRQPAGPLAKPAIVEGPLGGSIASYPGRPIAGTDDDVLYQTCRYDLKGYHLKLPNGIYRVTLKFCEPHFDAAGQRVCDVTLQGKTVLENLDIFARVGKFAALDHVLDGVEVTDGWLTLGLVYRKSLPCISAIVVEGPKAAKRINCGGPVYQNYAADWPATLGGGNRALPADDFYADWAAAEFGPEAAVEAAAVFAKIDSRLPRPASHSCPAGLQANDQPWEQAAAAYAFVDDLQKCRGRVQGAGNLDRFDYWVGTLEYLRATAKVECAWGQFNRAMAKVNAAQDAAAKKKLAAELALPAFRQLLDACGEVHDHLLATASTNGCLATIMFWQHAFFSQVIDQPAGQLAAALGGPLPASLAPWKDYRGALRVIVPTVRTSVCPGESLRLKVIVLSSQPPREATVHFRPLGAKAAFDMLPLKHLARGVYTMALPVPVGGPGLEYYVRATATDGKTAVFPATAPRISQTVILLPER